MRVCVPSLVSRGPDNKPPAPRPLKIHITVSQRANDQRLYEQYHVNAWRKTEDKQSQLRHPMALRTFIPTHQLVRTGHNVRAASSTQSLHPKSSLRTTRAILEYADPDAIEVLRARDDRQPSAFQLEPSAVNLLLGRSKSIVTTERVSYSLLKSPKGGERGSTTRNRRHARDTKTGSHSDDAIVVGFIDETVRPEQLDDMTKWPSNMPEERSKSFVLPTNNSSPSRRLSSPLAGIRSSLSNKERSFIPMTSPRNYNHHYNQRQHNDPSISSSTSSSSSSTIHITMLPPPPPITTTVIAETVLSSPSRVRPSIPRPLMNFNVQSLIEMHDYIILYSLNHQ